MNGAASDAVNAWCERDHARALLPIDHEIIESTRTVRELVALSIRTRPHDRDLWNACAVLGRLIAERGGSPTLAASTMDSAREALGDASAEWLVPARAALAEGFDAARREKTRAEAAKAWDYPACAVALDETTIAIAAGFPDADLDALEQWASRVAHDAALAGKRRAIVSGSKRAREALGAALSLAGIAIDEAPPRRSRVWRFFRRSTF
jgi:hypothetical protein